jgi:hypothetical protein
VAFDFQDSFEDLVPRPLAGPPRQAPPQTPNQAAIDAGRARNAPLEAGQTSALTAEADARTRQILNSLPGVSENMQRQHVIDLERARVDAGTEQFLRVARRYRHNFQSNDPLVTLGLSGEERGFDADAAGLEAAAYSIFRVPGTGADTEGDALRFARANRPGSQEWDQTNESRFDNLQTRLNANRQVYGLPPIDWRQMDEPPRQPQPQSGRSITSRLIDPDSEIGGAPPSISESQGQRITSLNTDPGFDPNAPIADDPSTNEASNTQQAVVDEARRTAARHIRDMILAGVPDEQVLAEATRSLGGTGNVRSLLDNRRRIGLRAYRRRGQPIDPSTYTTNRDLSLLERIHAGIAHSFPGAAVGHFANSATGNVIPELMGPQAREAMDVSRREQPVASFLGDVVGSIQPSRLIEAGVGRGLARLGANLGENAMLRYAPRTASNAIYGGIYGAADAGPNNRLEGGLLGAGTGALGGEVGSSAAHGLGSVVGGIRNPAARMLSDRGVTLTPGQILRGAEGRLGGLVGRGYSTLEQGATSFPVLGDAVSNQYQRSYRGAMNAAHNEALAPIGQAANVGARTGEELMQATDIAVSEAYNNAFQGVNLRTDRPFVRLFAGAERLGNRPSVTTPQRELLQPAFGQVRELFQNGMVDGRRYQAAMQIIRETRAAVRNTHLPGPAMSALDRAEASIRGLARRQRPEMLPALRNADASYRRASILRNAQMRAINAEKGAVTPGQFGLAIREQTRRYGGDRQASSTNRPFYALQDAMRQTLPERIPNSGTVGRLALPALIAGGAAGSDALGLTENALPYGLGAAAMYTNPGRAAMQAALIRRPQAFRRGGDILASPTSQRWASHIGRSVALPMIEPGISDPNDDIYQILYGRGGN